MKEKNDSTFQREDLRDDRLDIIKAISICLVLVWHLKPIQIVVGKTPNSLIKNLDLIIEQCYINLTLIAVPIFILTSLFLFFKKIQGSNYKYLIKRCKRLLELLIFWNGVQYFIYYLWKLKFSIESSTKFSWHIPNFKIHGFIEGIHPTLPGVGGSVFYFILILLELTIIAYILFCWKFNKFKNYIAIGIIIGSLVYFEYLNFTNIMIPYWRLDNFLVYLPIAYFMAYQENKINIKIIICFYFWFFIFVAQNIFLTKFIHHNIGIYSRVSIVFGALSLFSTCLILKNYQAPKSIKFMSTFSLGIFAIHKYWQFIISFLFPDLLNLLSLVTNIYMDGLILNMSAVIVALFITLLTFCSVYLLNLSPFQRFIK